MDASQVVQQTSKYTFFLRTFGVTATATYPNAIIARRARAYPEMGLGFL